MVKEFTLKLDDTFSDFNNRFCRCSMLRISHAAEFSFSVTYFSFLRTRRHAVRFDRARDARPGHTVIIERRAILAVIILDVNIRGDVARRIT